MRSLRPEEDPQLSPYSNFPGLLETLCDGRSFSNIVIVILRRRAQERLVSSGQARIYLPELFPVQGFAYTMIRRLDSLTTLLLATIFTTFLLFSCAAKQAPREITVKVPADYSGELNLTPCSTGAPAEVSVDSRGFGSTSACPRADETVTLTVIRGGADLRVPPDQVTIERAGDGLPVTIKARVPAR
jgi:hypothetical protein